ncbi:MAG TPA: GatB/YqeY domain-containing protein [Gammaproteobacteria bacterium]|jgi:hypothetical protein|nr:GatB/YqeY domain-containing protein [Gammaproteobacteria bacterium]
MTSAIKERILDDMKTAMRAQEKERLGTIRLILSACKQKEVDERIVLTDEHVLAILNKMIKQRRESIVQYQAGQRADLVAKEEAEIRIIQNYLPAQLSEADVDQAIAAALQETGATSAKDMGKVMGILKAKLQGKADMTVVSNKIKEKLAG